MLADIAPYLDKFPKLLGQCIQLIVRSLFHARPEGWAVIILLILPTTLIALFIIRQSKRRLIHEQETLQHHQKNVVKKRSRDEVLDYIKQTSRDTTVGAGLHAIYGFRYADSVDIEAIATLLRQREASHLGIARLGPNLLLLFGLFGTVLGLAGAVGELATPIAMALDAKSPEVLTNALRDTLSHMQTAFACTLWGILCATLVSYLTRKVSDQQSQMVAEVQQFIIHDVVPMVVLHNERAQLEELRSVVAQSSGALQAISNQVKEVSNKFTEQMGDIARILNENIDEFVKAMQGSLERAESVVDKISEVSTQVAKSLGEAVESIGNASSTLQSAGEGMKESAEKLGDYHEKLTHVQQSILEAYTQTQQSLEKQITDQIGHLTTLEIALEHWGVRTVSSASQVVDRLNSVMDSIDNGTEKAKEEFELILRELRHQYEQGESALRELFKRHGDQLAKVDQSILKVDPTIRDVAKQLELMRQSLSPQLLSVDEWRRLNQTLSELIRYLQSQSAFAGDDLLSATAQAVKNRSHQIDQSKQSGPISAGDAMLVHGTPRGRQVPPNFRVGRLQRLRDWIRARLSSQRR